MGVNVIRQYTGIPAKWIQYIYENYGIYTMLNPIWTLWFNYKRCIWVLGRDVHLKYVSCAAESNEAAL
jgi:hypothetical protein